MSKLNELLSNIITKVNTSVKIEAQILTAEQQKQARENIAAGSIIDVVELPTENIREDCFYRVTRCYLMTSPSREQSGYVVHAVKTLPEEPNERFASSLDIYYDCGTNRASMWLNNPSNGFPAGWYDVQNILLAMGDEYGGIVNKASDVVGKNTGLVVHELYYYAYGWKKVKDDSNPDGIATIAYHPNSNNAIGADVTIDAGVKVGELVKMSNAVPTIKDLVGSEILIVRNDGSSDFKQIYWDDLADTIDGAFSVVDSEIGEIAIVVYNKEKANAALKAVGAVGEFENGIYMVNTTYSDGTTSYAKMFKTGAHIRNFEQHVQPDCQFYMEDATGKMYRVSMNSDGALFTSQM